MAPSLLLALLLVACNGDGGVKLINTAPAATITQPSDDASFAEGTTIEFQGKVSDDSDDATELTVTWRLDGIDTCGPQAPESSGDTRCEILPDAGEHEVSLIVTDSVGEAGSATVAFSVIGNTAPVSEVTSPESGAVLVEGDLVNLEGVVSDVEDDVADLSVWWTSSVQELGHFSMTVDSDGTVSATGYLVAGEHAIQLHVEDTGGKATTDSVVLTVEPANSPPSCVIDSPSDGFVADTEDGLDVEGSVEDADQSRDSLSVSWASDRDGALSSSSPDTYGDVRANLDLSLGEHVITMTVTDDEGATCTDNVSISMDSAPAVDILAPSDGDVVQQGDELSVQVLAVDETDREEDLVVAWGTDLEGDLGSGSPDSDGDLSFTLSGLAAGTHHLTVTATDTVGFVGTETIELEVNAAPDAPSVEIAPEEPYTNDALVATASGGGDPDGGTIEYAYSWTVDGEDSSYAGTTIPASATTKDQLWAVRVVAVDEDGGESSAGAAAVTVLNSIPVTGTPTLSPTLAYTDDDLSCTPGSTTDLDDDTITYAYTWEIDGSSSTVTGGTLDAVFFEKGQVIRCAVTPNDGDVDGDTVWADGLTIANSPPEAETPTISPSDPSTDDDISCIAGTTTDADRDSTTIAYSWEIGGSVVAETSSTLASSDTDRGDVIRCGVTPSDDEEAGDTAWSEPISIENSLPVVDSVSISPTDPLTGDSLSCSATASDADGDTVSLAYGWEIGGSAVGSGATLSAAATAKGDDVFCVVTPSDAHGSGSDSSASVSIGDTAPSLTSLSITPSSPTVDSTLTANASGSDVDGDSVSFTYAWEVDSASVGTSSTLAASFVKGDVVQVTVTPVADSLSGSSDTTSVTIQNTPPTAPGVSISPDSPYSDSDTLTCSIDSVSTDADGDSISYAVSWTVDGVDAGISGYSVDYSETAPGDLWICTVTPSDDEEAGSSASASVSVLGDPVDYAHIQYPCSISTTVGTDVDIYGEVFELGVTEGAGEGSGIDAEVGYGATDVDPSADPDSWTWFDAIYNTDADGLTAGDLSNDEYFGIITAPDTAGDYAYVFRFTTDSGASWVYADLGDYCGYSGTDDGFDLADAGPMTVSE